MLYSFILRLSVNTRFNDHCVVWIWLNILLYCHFGKYYYNYYWLMINIIKINDICGTLLILTPPFNWFNNIVFILLQVFWHKSFFIGLLLLNQLKSNFHQEQQLRRVKATTFVILMVSNNLWLLVSVRTLCTHKISCQIHSKVVLSFEYAT